MTKEEAIKHAEEVADRCTINQFCAEEHRQLAEWLEELKTLKQKVCDDAVSREAVHDMLENLPITVEDKWFNWLQKACMRLAELPSVTPIRPKGRWIYKYGYVPYKWECDRCFASCRTDFNYCPTCGSEMISEE